MRLGQPTISAAYAEWYECRRKRQYASVEEAEESADWQQTPVSRPHAYDCRFCGAIHLGRPFRTKNQKRSDKRNQLRPTRKTVRWRPDVTLLDVLGPRAYWCGDAESAGHASKRIKVIQQRVTALAKRTHLDSEGP